MKMRLFGAALLSLFTLCEVLAYPLSTGKWYMDSCCQTYKVITSSSELYVDVLNIASGPITDPDLLLPACTQRCSRNDILSSEIPPLYALISPTIRTTIDGKNFNCACKAKYFTNEVYYSKTNCAPLQTCVDNTPGYAPLYQRQCSCTNGIGAISPECKTDGNQCASCNNGYYLSGTDCSRNLCTCPGGTSATSENCNSNIEGIDCASCSSSFTPSFPLTDQTKQIICTPKFPASANGVRMKYCCSSFTPPTLRDDVDLEVLNPTITVPDRFVQDAFNDCLFITRDKPKYIYFSTRANREIGKNYGLGYTCAVSTIPLCKAYAPLEQCQQGLPNLVPLYEVGCSCTNGIGTFGPECVSKKFTQDCKSCNSGYHLSSADESQSLSCKPNSCTCKNGVVATGANCNNGPGQDVVEDCQSCKAGYYLSSSDQSLQLLCNINRCLCPNGVAPTGIDCVNNGQRQCTSCNAGYSLSRLDAFTKESICGKCTCVNGVVDIGTQCAPLTDPGEDCRSCNPGFKLSPLGKNALGTTIYTCVAI